MEPSEEKDDTDMELLDEAAAEDVVDTVATAGHLFVLGGGNDCPICCTAKAVSVRTG